MLLFGNTQDFPVYINEAGRELFIPRDASGKVNPWELFKYEKLCFQDQLDFLDVLELEEFWESLEQEELDSVVSYLTWAMRNSPPSNRSDLQEAVEQAISDLEAIMRGEYVEGYDEKLFFTALYKHDPNIIACGFISNAWKASKKWVKKHKKPLIAIGVVATVLVVGALTGGIGASSAVAVGGALVGGSMDSPPDHINKPGEVFTDYHYTTSPPLTSFSLTPLPHIIQQQPPLQQAPLILEEKIDGIVAIIDEKKEELAETKNITPNNKMSDLGCSLGHSLVDGVASLVEYFYTDSSLEDYLNFIRYVDEYHEKVDNIFTYDDTKVDTSKWQMQMGTPPIPGGKLVPAVVGAVAETAVGTAIVGSVAGNIASSSGTQVIAREVGNVSVYRAFNPATNEVSYVGITNDLARRQLEHARERDINIEPIDNLTNLTRNDARCVEQTLIEHHELEKNGGTLINKINSIAESNPKHAEALTKGREILLEAEYPGIE